MTRDEVRRVSAMRRMAASGEARKLRIQGKVSLSEMAAAISPRSTASQVCRWECGAHQPRAALALAWADALVALQLAPDLSPTEPSAA